MGLLVGVLLGVWPAACMRSLFVLASVAKLEQIGVGVQLPRECIRLSHRGANMVKI